VKNNINIKEGKGIYRLDVDNIVIIYDKNTNEFNTNLKSVCNIEDLHNFTDALDLLLERLKNEEH